LANLGGKTYWPFRHAATEHLYPLAKMFENGKEDVASAFANFSCASRIPECTI
jgi:hypothetical protein